MSNKTKRLRCPKPRKRKVKLNKVEYQKIPLYVSSSSVQTAQSCPRKWYLEKVHKVERAPFKATSFGTVAHECLERAYKSTLPINSNEWLNEVFGYRKVKYNGKEYELPWWITVDGFGKGPIVYVPFGNGEATQFQLVNMIRTAFNDGTLGIRPDTVAEAKFDYILPEFDGSDGSDKETVVFSMGAVDIAHKYGIQDHKNVKSRWAKKTEELADDLQLNWYAFNGYEGKLKDGRTIIRYDKKEPLTIGQNQFLKDANIQQDQYGQQVAYGKVQVVEVETDYEHAKSIVEATRPTIEKMRQLVEASYWHVENKSELDPKGIDCNDCKSCGQYGGCQFRDYCEGNKSLQEIHNENLNKIAAYENELEEGLKGLMSQASDYDKQLIMKLFEDKASNGNG